MLNKSFKVLNKIYRMFSTSRQLQIPKNIQLRIDSHHNIHLTLNSQQKQVPLGKLQNYLEKLLECEQTGNKQLGKKYQKMAKAIWIHLNFPNRPANTSQENQFNPHQYVAQLLAFCISNPRFQFKIHHGLGKNVSIYKWLVDDLNDLVPPYSMFYISCGAIIIENDHILLVQEKGGTRKGQYGIPGGRADFGESLKKCAERQLFEQTGIKATYKYIMHFRELSHTLFGGSDIYFACLVEVQSLKQSAQNEEQRMKSVEQMINLCERQLNGYKWVHLKEYREFAEKYAIGTQKQLGRYMTQLYERGFNFKTQNPNKTIVQSIISKRDGVQRQFIQHLLSG